MQNLTNWQDSIALVKHAQPDLQSRTAGNYAGQLWAFSVAMNVGDIVVLPRKSTSQIALGRVTGKYKFLKLEILFGIPEKCIGYDRTLRERCLRKTSSTLSEHI